MTGARMGRVHAARRRLGAAIVGVVIVGVALSACTGPAAPEGSLAPTAEVPTLFPPVSSSLSATESNPTGDELTSPAPPSTSPSTEVDLSSGGALTGESTPTSTPGSVTSTRTITTAVLPSATSRSSPQTPTAVTTTGARTTSARTTSARTTPAKTTSPPAPPTTSRPARSHWQPAVGLTWQWQLSGTIDLTVDAAVYDLDMFETSAATVSTLHAMKRHVICYIDVGSWEEFRPDADDFPEAVKGASNGWPGERWLDIRKLDVLRPLMTRRMEQCASKGFDGVEPDLMDGFSNSTGFPITAADQLRYNRMIAEIGHSLGLAVGLKGDPEQASVLEPDFDYSINESCVRFSECDLLRPFIAAGKPVFHVEYSLTAAEFCPVTRPLRFSSMRKHQNLDAWREPC